MNYKLYFFMLLLLSSMPITAAPTLWQTFRGSPLVTAILGKPALSELPVIVEPNHTIATRLPVEVVTPSIWSRFSRMFNFFSWMDFTKASTPAPQEAAPAPRPAPAPAEKLPSEVATHLVSRLDALREEHEAKKQAELAEKEKDSKKIFNLVEGKIALKYQLERAQEESELYKKGWTALSTYTTQKEKLIEIQQEELRIKHATLLKIETEKDAAISKAEKQQEESLANLHEKNKISQQLRENELATASAQHATQETITRLTKTIDALKAEIRSLSTNENMSADALATAKSELEKKSSELSAAIAERNKAFEQIESLKKEKNSALTELKALETKYSNDQKNSKNELGSLQVAHEKLTKELHTTKEQASAARSSGFELNRAIEKKDEEIQNVQKVYQSEIAEIQQLLNKKRSEIDLLLAKLERSKDEHVVNNAKIVTENKQLIAQKNAFYERLRMTTQHANSHQRENDRLAGPKLPGVSKIVPQLPVFVESEKSELTNFEREKLSTVSPNGQLPIELLQSNIGTNPVLNTSITGKIADSFSELPLTPSSSPELLANKEANGSESILKSPLQIIQEKESNSFDPAQNFQMDPVFVNHHLSNGSKFMQGILTGNLSIIPTNDRKEYQQSIISSIWYLFGKAAEKGQAFQEGTIIIADQYKTFDFLFNYVKKVNPTITGTIQDPLLMRSNNPYGYSRNASHFVHLKETFRAYGIDIRDEENGPELPLLPADKRHILFGKLPNGLTWCKIENHGLGGNGFIGHAKEYAVAQTRKPTTIATSIRYIASLFGYTISTDQALEFRKERIPPIFIAKCLERLKKDQSINNELKKILKKDFAIQGYKMLTSPIIRSSIHFQDIIQECNSNPKLDHLHLRFGDEVIFLEDELLHSPNQLKQISQ